MGSAEYVGNIEKYILSINIGDSIFCWLQVGEGLCVPLLRPTDGSHPCVLKHIHKSPHPSHRVKSIGFGLVSKDLKIWRSPNSKMALAK